jgi:hypothetical protein
VKVGDLVTHPGVPDTKQVGLVIEVGKYRGNGDVKVLWAKRNRPNVQQSSFLRVLTAS